MNVERWQKIKELFSQAAELPVLERESFIAASGVDTQIRLEVEKMLVFADDENDILDASAFDSLTDDKNTALPEKIGKYKILREIGRGGMGTVYEAAYETDNFKQKVALKVIKRGMDTDAILRRFRHEQKILASLEHPNISHFLDGGMTEQGLPFYAMEFVEGEFIDDYCREQNLSINERLKLFRQVCSALQYAHQHLIIHRDLKSKNILVTADGTPKLLDFGIAKVLTPENAEEIGTATQFGMMTPAYASPEQIRGERIGTASDVYSLGVILYELLTGQKPYKINSNSQVSIERAICESEPRRPSEATGKGGEKGRRGGGESGRRKGEGEKRREGYELLQEDNSSANPKSEIQNPKFNVSFSPLLPFSLSSLRGDLDNIILKCLRKEPSERYVSVGQFSEDIRRYLDGLPVIARPHTFSYRATKFIKRNLSGVIAATIVFLSLCVGITVAIWQAHRAERQRILAESRFAEVRELANNVIFKYHDAIADLPGATATREMLVRDATKYLDNLARESDDNPELQRELANAYLKLGDVQGKQYGSNIGDSAGAVKSYRKATELLESVVQNNRRSGNPDLDVESDLVNAYESLFGIYMRVSDAEKINVLSKALAISENLVSAVPENQKYKLQNIGLLVLLGDSKRLEEKLAPYQKALPLIESLSQANPNDKEIIRLSARLNQRIGSSYEWLGDAAKKKADMAQAAENYAQALPYHQNTVTMIERLVGLEPNNASFKRLLAIASNNLSVSMAKNGQRAETLPIMNRGLEIFEQMEKADSRNNELKLDIAFSHESLAEIWTIWGDSRQAITEREKAIESHEEIWKRDGQNIEAVKGIVENYQFLAQLYRETGNTMKAEYCERRVKEYNLLKKNATG